MGLEVIGQMPQGTVKIVLDGQAMEIPKRGFYWELVQEWVKEGNELRVFDAVVTLDQLSKERDRRLSLGITVDFEDNRGEHVIGTRNADMVGWEEVRRYATLLLSTDQPDTMLTIVTDTGKVQISPAEWQEIDMLISSYRQTIFLSYFDLTALSPIPTEYADDKYWS